VHSLALDVVLLDLFPQSWVRFSCLNIICMCTYIYTHSGILSAQLGFKSDTTVFIGNFSTLITIATSTLIICGIYIYTMYRHIHVCIYTHICVCVNIEIDIHIYIHIYIYVHMYINIYMFIHICIHMDIYI